MFRNSERSYRRRPPTRATPSSGEKRNADCKRGDRSAVPVGSFETRPFSKHVVRTRTGTRWSICKLILLVTTTTKNKHIKQYGRARRNVRRARQLTDEQVVPCGVVSPIFFPGTIGVRLNAYGDIKQQQKNATARKTILTVNNENGARTRSGCS